jgi:hypothetical protein
MAMASCSKEGVEKVKACEEQSFGWLLRLPLPSDVIVKPIRQWNSLPNIEAFCNRQGRTLS